MDVDFRSKCYRCFRPEESCVCHTIKPFATNTKFIILIHPKEAKKNRIGTGRISHLFLENSELIMGVGFDDHPEVQAYLNDPEYFPVLLYPGNDAFNISEQPLSEFRYPPEKKLAVFILDGTWPCAKKMMKLSKTLQPLDRICFLNRDESLFKIKNQPDDLCLSTIESIRKVIYELNRVGLEKTNNAEEEMLVPLVEMVNYQINCSLDPKRKSYRSGTFKEKRDRIISKKWENRSIFYNGNDC